MRPTNVSSWIAAAALSLPILALMYMIVTQFEAFSQLTMAAWTWVLVPGAFLIVIVAGFFFALGWLLGRMQPAHYLQMFLAICLGFIAGSLYALLRATERYGAGGLVGFDSFGATLLGAAVGSLFGAFMLLLLNVRPVIKGK
jgi:hypothetical protein